MSMVWIVQATGNPRFPFRIALEQDGKTLFAVRSQDSWPGQRGNIFCVRDGTPADELDMFETLERLPVLSFDRFGKSLRITLDRPNKKRCEFLILDKPYKNKTGSYEQIFFKTQTAQSQHRSKSRLSLQPTAEPFKVVIDSAERYPWKFPKAEVERRRLPAGDYALVQEEKILSVVERKTFDNMVSDFGQIATLHRVLKELSGLPHPAMVIEADFGDFLNPDRLEHRYKPAHCYRALAEIQAMHPSLPIIFARTRKEANLWTYGYFRAVHRLTTQEGRDSDIEITAEPVTPYVAELRLETRVLELLRDNSSSQLKEDQSQQIESTSQHDEGLSLAEILSALGDADASYLKRVLQALGKRGLVDSSGRGKKRRWIVLRDQSAQKGS